MVVLKLAIAEGPPGAAVGTTATGMFGSGVGPGGGAVVGTAVGGGASVGGGGAFWLDLPPQSHCVWIKAVSCVGAAVGAGAQAPNIKAVTITKINGIVKLLFFIISITYSFIENGLFTEG